MVDLLLEKGADPNSTDCHGRPALIIVVETGQPDIVKLLLDYGANIEIVEQDEQLYLSLTPENLTPLLCAVNEEVMVVDLVQLLLERGANIRGRDSRGWTALHYVVNRQDSKDQEEVVRMLLEKGIPVDSVDDTGRTALHRTV